LNKPNSAKPNSASRISTGGANSSNGSLSQRRTSGAQKPGVNQVVNSFTTRAPKTMTLINNKSGLPSKTKIGYSQKPGLSIYTGRLPNETPNSATSSLKI